MEKRSRGAYSLYMKTRAGAASPLFLLILTAALSSPPAAGAEDICLGSAVAAGTAACRFKLWSAEGCFIQLAPDGPDCRALERISAVFVKLRDAAGFSEDQLKHLCATISWPETPMASYTAWNRCVNVNVAFLKERGDKDEAIQYAIAHEVSHGIQHQRGEMAWAAEVAEDESEAGQKEFERRRRVLEAQADVLSIQLLERAGFPRYAARNGFEACNGPTFISSTKVEGDHPSARSRWLNMSHAASLMSSAESEKRLQETLRKYGKVEGGRSSRLFEAAGEASASGAVTAGAPSSITPIFRREDFTDEGDLRLNRVTERLRREPPPLTR